MYFSIFLNPNCDFVGPDGDGWEWQRPTTVVMNGDLTKYFHPPEVESFQRHYHNLRGIEYFFPGLGNHDLPNLGENNDPDATTGYEMDAWVTLNTASCNAKHAAKYFSQDARRDLLL